MLRTCACLIASLLLLAAAPVTQACCFYNDARNPLFVLGPYTGNGWIVHPSNHRCTDGRGGNYKLEMLDSDEISLISTTAKLQVDKHGWIKVYPLHNDAWKAHAMDKNGSITATDYMRKTSSVPLKK
jgi:hypothetical protein